MTYDNRHPALGTKPTASAFDPDAHLDVGQSPKAEPVGPSIGEIIRLRRASLGLSLAQLAAKVECARSYLSMIETGVRGDGGAAISPALLVRLEGSLGLAPGMLTRAAQWSATPPGVRRQLTAMETSQRAAAAALRAVLGGSAGRGGSEAGGGSSAGTARHNLDDAFRSGRLHALVTQLEGGAGDTASAARPAEEPSTPARLLPVQVPLINSVAAGYPREFTDLGYPARVADEYVLSPDVNDPDAFAARVVGDSMLPDYREGDIVVFSPARTVKSGMDCFVRLERDHETTFKRIVLDDEASPREIRLVPLNPAFAERTVAREDVALLCAAVSVTRRI
jgi:SOS-response transcriptional repressor LexA/transcriptional regulator with XRE-family HTH domain